MYRRGSFAARRLANLRSAGVLQQHRHAASGASQEEVSHHRAEFRRVFGSDLKVVPLHEVVEKLTDGTGVGARSQMFNTVHTVKDAFTVAGGCVMLSTSNTAHSSWSVQKELSAVPDEGCSVTDVPFFHTKLSEDSSGSWFRQYNDIVHYDSASMRIIPVNRHSNWFVGALSRIIYCAPKEGLGVEELVPKLQELMGPEEADPTRHGFDALGAALLEVNDLHYIADGKIVPCHWHRVIKLAFDRCPPEGLTTNSFLRLLYAEVPQFRRGSLPGVSLHEWVNANFSQWFVAGPSRTDPSIAIFRKKETGVGIPSVYRPLLGWSGFDQDVTAVLNVLEQEAGSSTAGFDFEDDVLPLLPGASAGPEWYGATSWLDLVKHSSILDHNVRTMVRERPGTERRALFVDGSSLSPEAAQSIVGREGYSEGLVHTDVVRIASDAVHSASDHVIEMWFDPEFAIPARVLEAIEEKTLSSIVVLTSDSKVEKYVEALQSSLPEAANRSYTVTIASPQSTREV